MRDPVPGPVPDRPGSPTGQPTPEVGEVLRVLIVDDHPLVAEGFARLLGGVPGFHVIATVGSVAEAWEHATATAPDVVVVDQTLPDGRGTDLAGRLRRSRPQTGVVIVSALSDEAIVVDLVEAGCTAFVSKSRRPEELIRAVRAVAAGKPYLSLAAVRRLASVRLSARSRPDLTAREADVLTCLAKGLSNRAIGEDLGLSPSTVGNHIRRILEKLGVRSRLEALVAAQQAGLVPVPAPGSGPTVDCGLSG